MRSPAVRAVAALLAVVTTGCYTYFPVTDRPVPQGTAVRAELTDLGSATLGGYLGPGVDWLEGTMVDSDERSVTLAVAMTSGRRGESYWNRETATLPRDAILSLQQRELSKTRTFLASAGIIAGAFLLARAFSGGSAEGFIPIPGDDVK